MKASRAVVVLALLASLGVAGCQFSASASGEAKTGGESKLEGDASLETGSSGEAGSEEAIHYKEGKLDYEGTINFEYDRAEIRSDADTERTLSEFKKFLDKNPNVKISVEGHTDSRGSDDYNRKLSDRRAASVRDWLVKDGIADARVTSVGKGEDEPQVPEPAECDDKEPKDTSTCEAPWQANRRVVFRVTEGAETIKQTETTTAETKSEPEQPAPSADDRCHFLIGPRLGLLGPNSWVNLNAAVQPCLDWLELSLGVGLGLGNMDASSAGGIDADGSYWSLTVPLRARIGRFAFTPPSLIWGSVSRTITSPRTPRMAPGSTTTTRATRLHSSRISGLVTAIARMVPNPACAWGSSSEHCFI